MSSPIDRLTPAHWKRIADLRSRWIAAGLSTERADRARAEAAVARLYRNAGYHVPRLEWCGSPGAFADEQAARWREAGEDVKEVLRRATWTDVDRFSGLIDVGREPRVSAEIRHRVTSLLGEPVRRAVWAAVGASVASAVSRRWQIAIRDVAPRVPRFDPIDISFFGQLDAGACAYFDFFRTVCGLERETEPIAPMIELGLSCGWVLPYENVCWLAERPLSMRTDADGRLHAPDGPAMSFRDGWEIFVWRGLIVPRSFVVDPAAITGEEINAEPNAEVRRAMIERLGPERYLPSSGARLMHEDWTGRLWRKDFDGGRQAWAVVEVVNGSRERDGSRKTYYLQVPPAMTSARAAVAWTYGLGEDDYARVTRT